LSSNALAILLLCFGELFTLLCLLVKAFALTITVFCFVLPERLFGDALASFCVSHGDPNFAPSAAVDALSLPFAPFLLGSAASPDRCGHGIERFFVLGFDRCRVEATSFCKFHTIIHSFIKLCGGFAQKVSLTINERKKGCG